MTTTTLLTPDAASLDLIVSRAGSLYTLPAVAADVLQLTNHPKVDVRALKECIQRAGGLEAGLRYYVGAAQLQDDGGYADRVLAEQMHFKQVANGVRLSPYVPLPAAVLHPPPRDDSEVQDPAAPTPDGAQPQRIAMVH